MTIIKRKSIKPEKREKAVSTKGHYVTNEQILLAFHDSKEKGYLTPELAKCLMKIAEKYSFHPWFIGYPYRTDMVSAAVENLVVNWHKFNPEVSSNPFSYYTTACYRSFQSYKDDEIREADTKQLLLNDAGMNTSFNFQDRFGGKSSDDFAFSSPEKSE